MMTKFIPAEIIKKKRNGQKLSADELRFFVDRFLVGEIPDYQMTAFLMATFFRGMEADETVALTETMLHSGRVLSFSHLATTAVDKHSTGGIGDKTSMILAPIVAAAGAKVPMIAGRGLGHTGGTIDKLESIPGFRTDLTLEEFSKQVETLGVAIIGQTSEICPADKRIYALRDVTATIESLPLICASIMSKKIAEGIGALVLDVKHGTGAFMKTLEQAELLADKLMEIGSAHGLRVASVLSSMDQPLGRFIGNSLEMGECYAILKNTSFMGRAPSDFEDTKELSLELAGQMIWLSGVAANPEEGRKKAETVLASGAAWEVFEKLSHAQGASDPEALPMPSKRFDVVADHDGFVSGFDGEKLGLAAISLGAGRMKTSDPIDPTAGIEVHRKLGDGVTRGDKLFTLYASATTAPFETARDMVHSATNISLQKPSVPALITKKKVV